MILYTDGDGRNYDLFGDRRIWSVCQNTELNSVFRGTVGTCLAQAQHVKIRLSLAVLLALKSQGCNAVRGNSHNTA